MFCVPKVEAKLLSVSETADKDPDVLFTKTQVKLFSSKRDKTTDRIGDLYFIRDCFTDTNNATAESTKSAVIASIRTFKF